MPWWTGADVARLLVLGGTRHVGRAAIEDALGRGWDVTAVNRGNGRPEPPGVRAVRADRGSHGSLATALDGQGPWDIVLDTWSGAPLVVDESARLLAERASTYAYVSSISVYRWPWVRGGDESAPVVEADAGAGSTDYAADKRGAELAVLETFGSDRALIARAGLILGPYEQVGRLPWWLQLVADGGTVPVPGPPDRPLQLIDGRDLAGWLLSAAAGDGRGVVNAAGPVDAVTMGALLDAAVAVTGSGAVLDWLTPEQVAATGIEPWTELPIWTPPEGELACVHDIGTARAQAMGLVCRPVGQTVADTWAWLQAEGYPDSVIPPAGARWTRR